MARTDGGLCGGTLVSLLKRKIEGYGGGGGGGERGLRNEGKEQDNDFYKVIWMRIWRCQMSGNLDMDACSKIDMDS